MSENDQASEQLAVPVTATNVARTLAGHAKQLSEIETRVNELRKTHGESLDGSEWKRLEEYLYCTRRCLEHAAKQSLDVGVVNDETLGTMVVHSYPDRSYSSERFIHAGVRMREQLESRGLKLVRVEE